MFHISQNAVFKIFKRSLVLLFLPRVYCFVSLLSEYEVEAELGNNQGQLGLTSASFWWHFGTMHLAQAHRGRKATPSKSTLGDLGLVFFLEIP